MPNLTPAQVSRLKSAGISDFQIAAYKAGKLSPMTGTNSQILNILKSPTAGNVGIGVGRSTVDFAGGLRSTPGPKDFANNQRSVASPAYTAALNQRVNAGTDFAGGQRSVAPAGTGTIFGNVIRDEKSRVAQQQASRLPQLTYTDAERDANDAALDRTTPGRQAERASWDQAPLPSAPGLPGASPYPSPPSYPDINVPELVVRDFLDKAKQEYAAAYAPLYEALNMGKQNAQGNYNNSDAVVKGLYEGLANDVKQTGQESAAQANQMGAQSQAQSQALQDRIGQIYGGSSADTSGLAASLGQQAAGAAVTGGNTAESQYQQTEAAKSGQSQQDLYNRDALASQNYGNQMSTAVSTEGAGRRSDLVKQLNDVLSQYDQQTAGYKSQEGLGAIQQSNVLSDRDLSQQQARINSILSEAGITDARIGSQYAAQTGQWDATNQARQEQYAVARQQYEDAVKADENRRAELAAIQAADQAAIQQRIDNNYKGREVAATEQNAQTAAAEAAAKGADTGFPGSPTGDFKDAPARTQVIAQADQLHPGQGENYERLFEEMMNGVDPNEYGNLQTFGERAAQVAKGKGLNPEIARAVSGTFWQKIMNRS